MKNLSSPPGKVQRNTSNSTRVDAASKLSRRAIPFEITPSNEKLHVNVRLPSLRGKWSVYSQTVGKLYMEILDELRAKRSLEEPKPT